MKPCHDPIFLPGPDSSLWLAQALVRRLAAGDVLLLQGEIGAGKTHFARGIIQALVNEDVPSPTFTLVQIYEAPEFEIWHADLYRLGHPDEAEELGLRDAFETAVCLVEWPEKLGDMQPEGALTVQFRPLGEGREIRFLAAKQSAASVWAARLEGVWNV